MHAHPKKLKDTSRSETEASPYQTNNDHRPAVSQVQVLSVLHCVHDIEFTLPGHPNFDPKP